MSHLPDGAWPVMLTPFSADLRVDWDVLDRYTDWLIAHEAAGLFPVALSGEMYEMPEAERLEVARRVVERAAGRVPVLASIAEAGTDAEIAAAAARLAATGVDAVVLIAALLLPEGADERTLRATVTTVLESNPGIRFGIYECPLPYHRILSLDAVQWLADTGRFVFFKETSHDVALMAQRVAAASGTPMKVYNAGIETLVESLEVGVSGLSGWVVNIYPEYVARLCAAAAGIPREEALAFQDVLDRVERGMGATYPSSAKYLLERRAQIGFQEASRWRPEPLDHAALDELASLIDTLPAAHDPAVTR
jgi:4-hydroxy-tetrahydrodipicolinate synthase